MNQTLPPVGEDAVGPRTDRPRRKWLLVAILSTIALVLFAGGGAYLWRQVEAGQSRRPPVSVATAATVTHAPRVGGPFSLVNSEGKPVTDRDFRGRFMLIYFGYTKCPNHCSTMLMMTAATLEALGPEGGQLQPIFITVDPQHDTPEIVGRYTRNFSPRILGLTGSPAQVEAAERAYGVEILFRRTGPRADDYVIDHTSVLYLVGPDGRFIAELDSEGNPDVLAPLIRQLLRSVRGDGPMAVKQ